MCIRDRCARVHACAWAPIGLDFGTRALIDQKASNHVQDPPHYHCFVAGKAQGRNARDFLGSKTAKNKARPGLLTGPA
eukprot:8845827-Alexandrium_andersonii.AAC.1